MPSKMQFYAQMADQAAKQITGSYQSWISFLKQPVACISTRTMNRL